MDVDDMLKEAASRNPSGARLAVAASVLGTVAAVLQLCLWFFRVL